MISIHALLWSATLICCKKTRRLAFLSTHSCGVRPIAKIITNITTEFLSTHSCGVRLFGKLLQLLTWHFYPRTPVECDFGHGGGITSCPNFYPRTPVECDSYVPSFPRVSCWISIHALLWSATHTFPVFPEYPVGFLSTHSCGVRQKICLRLRRWSSISIHALLWSATARFDECKEYRCISIHALLWSATMRCRSMRISHSNISIHALLWSATETGGGKSAFAIFLSTHSCGVRLAADMAELQILGISIHALLWSATKNWQYRNIGDKISIHALLWSATLSLS